MHRYQVSVGYQESVLVITPPIPPHYVGGSEEFEATEATEATLPREEGHAAQTTLVLVARSACVNEPSFISELLVNAPAMHSGVFLVFM